MNYKIYQIKDVENCPYSFRPFMMSKRLNFSLTDYEVVYEGTVDKLEFDEENGNSIYRTLDYLFVLFNLNHPTDFRGHSMSVSDIIELDNEFYYVDSIGFENITDCI